MVFIDGPIILDLLKMVRFHWTTRSKNGNQMKEGQRSGHGFTFSGQRRVRAQPDMSLTRTICRLRHFLSLGNFKYLILQSSTDGFRQKEKTKNCNSQQDTVCGQPGYDRTWIYFLNIYILYAFVLLTSLNQTELCQNSQHQYFTHFIIFFL